MIEIKKFFVSEREGGEFEFNFDSNFNKVLNSDKVLRVLRVFKVFNDFKDPIDSKDLKDFKAL